VTVTDGDLSGPAVPRYAQSFRPTSESARGSPHVALDDHSVTLHKSAESESASVDDDVRRRKSRSAGDAVSAALNSSSLLDFHC